MQKKIESTTSVEEYLDQLNWRYATKRFDADQKIPDHLMDALLESVRLSASSYGLQPYKVLVITDPELREKLRPLCWNQAQITEASAVLVFANYADFDGELIDSYLETVAEVRNTGLDQLKGYGDFMKSKLLDLPSQTKAEWTARQAYIALGNLLSAAAAFRIDACPMEGFEREKVNELLDLPSKGLSAAVIAPVGYRSEEDATQHNNKVRRPENELFVHL